jgi:hypothetical protein
MMPSEEWKWANLTEEQLKLVALAEQTLDVDYVLVYQSDTSVPEPSRGALPGLRPARMNDSQLECLRGLEQQFGAVAVAYERVA